MGNDDAFLVGVELIPTLVNLVASAVPLILLVIVGCWYFQQLLRFWMSKKLWNGDLDLSS